MKPNHKLSRTIAAILSASAAHAILAADANPTTAANAAAAPATADATAATADATASSGSLQTVIVTAQRRDAEHAGRADHHSGPDRARP